MNSINLQTAKCLAVAQALSSAEIQCLDGKKWVIVLRGQSDFVLKSDRQNPRRFGTLETALAEIRHLGLQRCEINLERWLGKTPRQVPASLATLTAKQ